MISCDPQSLSKASACFLECVSAGNSGPLKSYLLCQVAMAGLRPILDISGSSSNGNTILTWTNPNTPPDQWQIWRSINGAAFIQIATVPGNLTTFTDTGNLAANAEWDYQIRGVRNGKNGAFSIPAGAGNLLTTTGPGVVFYPNLVIGYGSQSATGGTVSQYNAPRLHTLTAGLNIDNLPMLVSFDLRGLQTSGTSIFISLAPAAVDPLLVQASFPSLISLGSDLWIENCTVLTSISAPKCIKAFGGLYFDGCIRCTSIVFPLVQTIGSDLELFNLTGMTSFSFPSLTGISTTQAGNFLAYGCPNVTSANFPVLNSVNGFIDFSGDTALTTLAFPALTTLQTGITCGPTGGAGTSATNLKSVSIPNLVFPASTSVIDFQGCALDVTSVNLILRRAALALPGMNACTITLQGGTNAAPTGQGVADKAALIAGGNTVTTN